MSIQNHFRSVHFGGPGQYQPLSDEMSLRQRKGRAPSIDQALLDDDSDTFDGDPSREPLIPGPALQPKPQSSGLFSFFTQRPEKKQESATARMKNQIQASIYTQEKERKQALKAIYYLALEYSWRSELQDMILLGSRDVGATSRALNSTIHYPAPAIKNLQLAKEIPDYELGVFKMGRIQDKALGKYQYHALWASGTTTESSTWRTVDDMGHLFNQIRYREPDGELRSHERYYAPDLAFRVPNRHLLPPMRPLEKMTDEERMILRENLEELKKLNTEMETIKKDQLTPIDAKIAQYKDDLETLEKAVKANSEELAR